MGNPICWFEIGTRDLEKSKKFYDSVFDWGMKKDPNFPDMEMIDTGAPLPGAIFKIPPDMPLGVHVYFQVDSIVETLKKVEESEGLMLMPRTEIPMAGWFAVFKDPEGVMVSIFEPKQENKDRE